jgi:carbon monoxide dehydrogenase subunit G
MAVNNNSGNSRNQNYITIKRSTFNKIIIVAVVGLMAASFLGGYNFVEAEKTVTAVLQGNGGGSNASLTTGIQLPQQQPRTPAAVVEVSSL